MNNAAIEFIDVAKVFSGNIRALDNVSFCVTKGEVVVLLGSSGSGKTTALRLMNRILEPTQGTVLLNGIPLAEREPISLRRSIGYVIQEGGLFPHWTNAENVALVPKLLKWSKHGIMESVKEHMALARISYEEYGSRYPASLSGGQRQRVAIARALAARPSLLLFDEAFGGLDPITRDELHAEVGSLIKRLGITAIIVTHDVVEAFKLADRIVLFDKGRIIQCGTPARLALAPVHDFTRDFFRNHGLELRMTYLRIEDVISFLKVKDSSDLCAVDVPGDKSLAVALHDMARGEYDHFFAVCRDGGRHGPFDRKDVWQLLQG